MQQYISMLIFFSVFLSSMISLGCYSAPYFLSLSLSIFYYKLVWDLSMKFKYGISVAHIYVKLVALKFWKEAWFDCLFLNVAALPLLLFLYNVKTKVVYEISWLYFPAPFSSGMSPSFFLVGPALLSFASISSSFFPVWNPILERSHGWLFPRV